MPYIKLEDRDRIDEEMGCDWAELGIVCKTSGELNYALTRILMEYAYDKGVCYETYNSILGVLSGVKLEIYRRMIAKYENLKCDENGDVY